MANAEKLVSQMRSNPRDWRLGDIETDYSAFGIECTLPRNGSHFKIKHPAMTEILTIPAKPPIKPIYVRLLVRFIDKVRGEGA